MNIINPFKVHVLRGNLLSFCMYFFSFFVLFLFKIWLTVEDQIKFILVYCWFWVIAKRIKNWKSIGQSSITAMQFIYQLCESHLQESIWDLQIWFFILVLWVNLTVFERYNDGVLTSYIQILWRVSYVLTL